MLTDRDKEIIKALPLNTVEINERFFNGKTRQWCLKRLKTLEKHGYIKHNNRTFESNSYVWEVIK